MVSPRGRAVSSLLDSAPMVKDPRQQKPGSTPPDDAIDLLRALARSKGPSTRPAPPRPPADTGEEKLDALRALAERLDMQLRAPPDGGPYAPHPGDHPLATPLDTPFGDPVAMPPPPRRADRRDPTNREHSDGAPGVLSRLDAQRVIFIAISVAVLVAAAVGGVMRHRGAPGSASAPQTASPTAPRITPPAQIVPPTDAVPPVDQAPAPPQPVGPPDIAAITKSMSDCDAAAGQDPGGLYFLILPLTPANPADQSWRSLALQTVGSDILLLSAKDALDGLRANKLNVRTGRYTFSVLDSTSGATFSWTSATSLARLSKAKVDNVKSLRLGFDFSTAQAGPQWSAEFKRDVGACYWVSVLVRQ
jgi:hypothetical protein